MAAAATRGYAAIAAAARPAVALPPRMTASSLSLCGFVPSRSASFMAQVQQRVAEHKARAEAAAAAATPGTMLRPLELVRADHAESSPSLSERARRSGRRFMANNLHLWIKWALFAGIYGGLCWWNGRLLWFGSLTDDFMSSKNKRASSVPTTRLKDVCGCDEAKAEMAEVVEFLKNPAKFTKLGGKMPKGVLLTGPPGTGKTLLARAVAGEAGVPFFSATGSDFEEMFVGVGAKRMRELFAEAKKVKPAIVFIDEIDSVGGKRHEFDHPKTRMSLNQLLSELDGFSENSGIIVMAATNFAESLDPALLRPGRFDRHLNVPVPDIKGRKEILQLYGKKMKLEPDIDLSVIARSTAGMSGADLEQLLNTAALRASSMSKPAITLEDIEHSKDKILMGAERKSGVNSEEMRRHIAFYEGGKSLVALLTPSSTPLHKVTILERGTGMGHTAQVRSSDEDKTSENYTEMIAALDTRLAGRVAEELIYGADGVTTHAEKDLARAHDLCRRMVTLLGFGATLGPVSHAGWSARGVSTRQKADVDREVNTLLQESHKRVTEKLKQHEPALHKLAGALLKNEVLDAKQIKDIVAAAEGSTATAAAM